MKLLIVTQVVDVEHPILGFFHRWIEEFAKNCEEVHVICLQEGKHSLPESVKVYSLGKESGGNRLTYLFRFYKLIWQLRHVYDNVFVHMNQIYVILGAPLWRIWGKKIGLWYMHGSVSSSLKLAEKLTDKIFTGSAESFRLKSNKVFVTGHGIDTHKFAPQSVTKDLDLITVGRITPAKNLLEQIDILKAIRETNDVKLNIVGVAVTTAEAEYEKKLRAYMQQQDLIDYVNFVGRVQQAELPLLLNRAKVFITTAQNGSLDKAILEAMACGLPVVSSASGSISLPLKENQVNSIEGFILRTNKILQSDTFIDNFNVGYTSENHSINSLVPKICIDFYEL